MNTQIGYKIVSKKDEKLYSAASITWDESSSESEREIFEKFVVEYKQNEYVYPKIDGTGLYVFSNFYDAQQFYFRNFISSRALIFKCEYIPSEDTQVLIVKNLDYIRKYYKAIIAGDFESAKYWTNFAPAGSVLAKSVKLLERVDA